MTITDVATRGLASDVAVAVVTLDMGEFTTPEGELKAGTQDKLSLILVKRADGWRITHGHNTVIDPGRTAVRSGEQRLERLTAILSPPKKLDQHRLKN